MALAGPANKRGCDLCAAVHRPFVCPDCINHVAQGENKRELLGLIGKRAEVLALLEAKMEQQVGWCEA